MQGYISYDRDSLYSPEHEFPIAGWSSPSLAIEGGEDPSTIITMFVSMRRDLFFPVRTYSFKGAYGFYVNKAVSMVYKPKRERVDISSYVVTVSNPPDVPTVTVNRNVYVLEKVGDNIYRQRLPLLIYEEYRLGIMEVMVEGVKTEVPLYIGGDGGSFILLSKIPLSLH